ncbi:MAG: transcription-repair coupling factor, partial [Verrucomicrobiota bacterium]
MSWSGITPASTPFLVAALCRQFPDRSILVVVDSLKTQEQVHADLNTWLAVGAGKERSDKSQTFLGARFFPAWDVLPTEKKLPHVDIVSERLESLMALSDPQQRQRPIVATVTALQQLTFGREALAQRVRDLARGDTCNPLDLIEWLEEQGYEPETQVTGKGELSWRGGIVDLWPMSS